MFLYELLALQFPFERQNLMHNQIEKLVVEGDRPSLQNKVRDSPTNKYMTYININIRN